MTRVEVTNGNEIKSQKLGESRTYFVFIAVEEEMGQKLKIEEMKIQARLNC